ncbi:MAG: hypothetical protein KDA79_11300 [Planctomycetaceae bacterium]|nr:hypothetical protein [Planctomycetaceae bacterium]
MRNTLSIAVALALLWLPFAWVLLRDGRWTSYRLMWVRMLPILPGFSVGMLFHPHDGAMLTGMAAATVCHVLVLVWLCRRGGWWIGAAWLLALLIGGLASGFAWAVYHV